MDANFSANHNCNKYQIANTFPIAIDISYFVASGLKIQDPGMVACCGPNNAVNLIDNCYVWCELPQRFAGTLRAPRTQREALDDFSDCLDANGTKKEDRGFSIVRMGENATEYCKSHQIDVSGGSSGAAGMVRSAPAGLAKGLLMVGLLAFMVL